MALRITNYLITNKIITADRQEEKIYEFEVLIGKILNYGTLLLISYINRNIILTSLFMITFFALRGRTGGYHCRNSICCYFGTIAIYIFVTWGIYPILLQNIGVTMLTLFLSSIIIICLAPVNHPNLNLDEEEIKICKSSARWLTALIDISVLIFLWLQIMPAATAYVVAGIGLDAGLLMIAKIIKQEVRQNEEDQGKTIANSPKNC